MGHSFAHTIPKPGPYMSHTISFRKGYDEKLEKFRQKLAKNHWGYFV